MGWDDEWETKEEIYSSSPSENGAIVEIIKGDPRLRALYKKTINQTPEKLSKYYYEMYQNGKITYDDISMFTEKEISDICEKWLKDNKTNLFPASKGRFLNRVQLREHIHKTVQAAVYRTDAILRALGN